MDYFYIHPKHIRDNVALLRDDEHKHLTRVVRKKAGERIVLVDGEDHAFEAVIRSIAKDQTECEILSSTERLNEPAIDLTLGVSILRNPARFDILVEKTTELGVRTIVPLICERTIPRSEKHSRLEKIALSAMKQCGRCYCPRIKPLTTFEEALENSDEFALRLLPHEQLLSSPSIPEAMVEHTDAKKVLILVGPEGGFTEGEVKRALEKGFLPVSLGQRRLRTETAAIAAVGWTIGTSEATARQTSI